MLKQAFWCFCESKYTHPENKCTLCSVAWMAADGKISAPHEGKTEKKKIILEAMGNRLALKLSMLSVPPRVAERRRWVPYFLIRLSVIMWRVGLLPSWRTVCMKSGSRGKAKPPLPPKPSRFSTAKLLTFHRPNSLETHTKIHLHTSFGYFVLNFTKCFVFGLALGSVTTWKKCKIYAWILFLKRKKAVVSTANQKVKLTRKLLTLNR